MKTYTIKTIGLLLIINLKIFSQNVGISNSVSNPHPSALLDVDASANPNRGILIPRIPLNGTNVSNPVVSPATSLLVFNTSTSGSGIDAVSPGYYYWEGTKWVRLLTELKNIQTLSITGNSISISNGNTVSLPIPPKASNWENIDIIPTNSSPRINSNTYPIYVSFNSNFISASVEQWSYTSVILDGRIVKTNTSQGASLLSYKDWLVGSTWNELLF